MYRLTYEGPLALYRDKRTGLEWRRKRRPGKPVELTTLEVDEATKERLTRSRAHHWLAAVVPEPQEEEPVVGAPSRRRRAAEAGSAPPPAEMTSAEAAPDAGADNSDQAAVS